MDACNIERVEELLALCVCCDKTKRKVGLDVHGVITKYPEVFAQLTHQLLSRNHEVHIVTGARVNRELVEKLIRHNIVWTTIFSIVDYHELIGTRVRYDENGPWIKGNLWDKTKAQYAKKVRLDWHIDDSEVYGKFFKKPTRYVLLK